MKHYSRSIISCISLLRAWTCLSPFTFSSILAKFLSIYSWSLSTFIRWLITQLGCKLMSSTKSSMLSWICLFWLKLAKRHSGCSHRCSSWAMVEVKLLLIEVRNAPTVRVLTSKDSRWGLKYLWGIRDSPTVSVGKNRNIEFFVWRGSPLLSLGGRSEGPGKG